ncbi:hypothetical protein PanWU01x14_028460, partial [Parasponia andersonii]
NILWFLLPSLLKTLTLPVAFRNNGFKSKPRIATRYEFRIRFNEEAALPPRRSDASTGRGPCRLVPSSLRPRGFHRFGQEASGLSAIPSSSPNPPIFCLDGNPSDAAECKQDYDSDGAFCPVSYLQHAYRPGGGLLCL